MIQKILLIFIYCFFINGLLAQPDLEWYGISESRWQMRGHNSWHFDDHDNLYYIGFFSENKDLDINSNSEYYFTHPTTNERSSGFGIVKYDTKGNLIWVKGNPLQNLSDSRSFQILYTKLHDDTIYVIGKFFQNGFHLPPDFDNHNHWIANTNADLFILQYDLNGRFKKADKMYVKGWLGGVYISDLIVDEDKSIHLTGRAAGIEEMNLDIKNQDPAYLYKGTSLFYVHYSKDFNIIKHFVFDGKFPQQNFLPRFTFDKHKNMYFAGDFSGTIDLDPGKGEQIIISNENTSFVVKLDKDGNYLWGKDVEFDEIRGMFVDDDDNLYIGATLRGTKNLNINGEPMYYESSLQQMPGSGSSVFASHPFVAKYNSKGVAQSIQIIQFKPNNTAAGFGRLESLHHGESINYAIISFAGTMILSDDYKVDAPYTAYAFLEFDDQSMKNIHTLSIKDIINPLDAPKAYGYSITRKGTDLLTYGFYNGDTQIPEYDITLPHLYPKYFSSEYVALFKYESDEDDEEETTPIEGEKSNFIIYPNPSNGQFTIEVDKPFWGTTYKIFEESGRKIYEGKIAQQENEVSINVATGVYIISFYREDEIIKSHKIIIKQ